MVYTNIVVTGAASGLGLAIVVALAEKYPNSAIYALDRQPRPNNFPGGGNSQIQYHQFNITNGDEVKAFGEELNRLNVALDLVVHCAGVRGLVPKVPIHHSDDVATAETLEIMDVETMHLAFDVNALGFLMLMKALIPSLKRAAVKATQMKTFDRSSDEDNTQQGAVKVVVLGSRMGSIGHNTTLGGGYAYRASKAALNAILKSLSIDVPEVIWTNIHPGRVETGLVAVKEEGAMTVEESLNDLLPLIDRLGKEDSGTFVDRFGVAIPW